MKIVKLSVNDLRVDSASFGESFRDAPLLIQCNTKYDYLYISPTHVGNALFRLHLGITEADYMHVRAGSIVPIKTTGGQRAQDLRICLSPVNMGVPEIASVCSTAYAGQSFAGNRALLFDNQLSVEFLLLEESEARCHFFDQLKPGDIVFSGNGTPNAWTNIAASNSEVHVSGEIMAGLAHTQLSLRARLSGGWGSDWGEDEEPLTLQLFNAHGEKLTSHIYGWEVWPYPGIGEAYLQFPLVGFSNAYDTTGGYDVLRSRIDSSHTDFSDTAGYPYLSFEVVAGHLDPMWHYYCSRFFTDGAGSTPSAANEPRQYYARTRFDYGGYSDRVSMFIRNLSAVGIWRTRQIIFARNELNDLVLCGAGNKDTNAGANTNTVSSYFYGAQYYAMTGYFTALPTNPEVAVNFI